MSATENIFASCYRQDQISLWNKTTLYDEPSKQYARSKLRYPCPLSLYVAALLWYRQDIFQSSARSVASSQGPDLHRTITFVSWHSNVRTINKTCTISFLTNFVYHSCLLLYLVTRTELHYHKSNIYTNSFFLHKKYTLNQLYSPGLVIRSATVNF